MEMNKNTAAQMLGRLAGKKRLKEGGREAFVEMAKKSWQNRTRVIRSKEYYQEMNRKSQEARRLRKG